MADSTTGPSPQQQQPPQALEPFPLPRVTIRFCTQCKWMLRAAYFAQELLSTFSTSLGEVALQPSTGGTFIVTIQHSTTAPEAAEEGQQGAKTTTIQTRTLWDRKIDGGFPETKELKRRVRDVIEPGRNLGHVDRDHRTDSDKKKPEEKQQQQQAQGTQGSSEMLSEGQQQQQPPSGPRWPTSVSVLQAQQAQVAPQTSQDGDGKITEDRVRRGHSRPMIPADDEGNQTTAAGEEASNNRNSDPIRKGHSQPMIPASGDDNDGSAFSSQSWRTQPPHSTAPGTEEAGREDDNYQPKMPGGGVKPLVKPASEASNAEFRAKVEKQEAARRKEECEDCQ